MQNTIDQYLSLIRADFSAPVEIQTLPAQFEDATHQLFKVTQQNQQSYCYKCCHFTYAQSSPFWQGMSRLFETSLKNQLSKAPYLYDLLSEKSPLTIPQLESLQTTSDHVVLKTSWLSGSNFDTPSSSEIRLITQHLQLCHQISKKVDTNWQNKLVHLIEVAVKIPQPAKPVLLAKAKKIKETQFGLIMPDLRWDQFMRLENQQIGFTDLDALVFGPITFDFVILEYLLTSSKIKEVFKKSYENTSKIPRLNTVREVYRAVLFEMNILGEQDYQKWMQHPVIFD